MRGLNLWCAILCAGLVGWLGQPNSPIQAADPKPSFDKIELSSSGGFSGRGSGKALSVDAQGKFTARAGGQQKQGELKADELKRLRELVAAVDWKGVKKSYRGQGADFFQDDLVVTVGGKASETHVSEDTPAKQLPEALQGLLVYLRKLHAQYKP